MALTVVGVRNAKPGRHSDGKGLYLFVQETGGKSWVLRVQVQGRRRDIGLGSVETLSLSEARDKAAELRKAAKLGKDPVEERDRDRRPIPSFKEAAKECHKALASGWSDKTAKAFLSSLNEHAYKALGSRRVDQIEASHIQEMLAPIWTEVPVMARKVLQRVGIVLNYATSKGWRIGEAPSKAATMGLARGHRGGNFAAMPYAEVPAFHSAIEGKTVTSGRLALRFLILTAARSGEVRHARWDQIDLENKLWNRPASIMKAKKAHSVTLSSAAIEVLGQARRLCTSTDPDALIFPSSKSGAPLSDTTLSKVMRDAKVAYVPHGFRSSFRDFAAEQMPTIPDPVAEVALAHQVKDAVERAYKRATFLEMRRQLLDGWADHLAGKSNVVRLAVANG